MSGSWSLLTSPMSGKMMARGGLRSYTDEKGRIFVAGERGGEVKANGYLVHADGKREPTTSAGGLRVITHKRREDGRVMQITFDAAGVADDGLPEYVEGETRDVSEATWAVEARMMVDRAKRSGAAIPAYVLQGMHLGETPEEFARRIEILRPWTK